MCADDDGPEFPSTQFLMDTRANTLTPVTEIRAGLYESAGEPITVDHSVFLDRGAERVPGELPAAD